MSLLKVLSFLCNNLMLCNWGQCEHRVGQQRLNLPVPRGGGGAPCHSLPVSGLGHPPGHGSEEIQQRSLSNKDAVPGTGPLSQLLLPCSIRVLPCAATSLCAVGTCSRRGLLGLLPSFFSSGRCCTTQSWGLGRGSLTSGIFTAVL